MSVDYRSTSVVSNTATSHDVSLGYYVPLSPPSGLSVGDQMTVIVVANTSHVLKPTSAGWTVTSTVCGLGFPTGLMTVATKTATPADLAVMTLGYSLSSATVSAAWIACDGEAHSSAYWAGIPSSTTDYLYTDSRTSVGVPGRVLAIWGNVSGGSGLAPNPPSLPSGTYHANISGGCSLLVADIGPLPAGVASGTNVCYANLGSVPGTVMIRANQPPSNASITAPADASTFLTVDDIVFDWHYDDPDGDAQGSADLRYSSDGGSTWTPLTGVATTASTYTLAGGTLAVGTYQAQVKVYDAPGLPSAGWSPSVHFTVSDAPPAPVITTPTTDEAVGFTQAVGWTVTDQDAYEIRRVADDGSGSPDPSVVYYDSGALEVPAARLASLAFPTNSRVEHVEARVRFEGLWSDWDDIRVAVAWTPPETPALTLTRGLTPPSIQVDVVTVLDSLPSDAVSVDLYLSTDDGATSIRVKAGLAPTDSWIYDLPAAGIDYSFQAIAYAADGSPAASAWIGSASYTAFDLRTTIIDGGGA